MKFFAQITALLFALFACAFAQSYDATIYVTSTVYKVNTVYASSSPTASVANMTSVAYSTSAATTNATKPTFKPSANSASSAKPSPSQFTAGASALHANAAIAAFIAGVGYIVL